MSSPYVTVFAQADHAPQATPATPETFVLGEIQYNGTVSEVTLIPAAAVTPDNTNNRTFTVVNKGGDGLGNVVIATLVTNIAGGAWVAGDEKPFTLSATAGNLNVVANDVLECVETVAGTGVAHPQLELTVKGQRK